MTHITPISVEHKLYRVWVGPANAGRDIILFRAPVVLDGSGTYKRLPHQVEWKHLQEGDAVIAMLLGESPAGQMILDLLQFWQIVKKDPDDDETFEVEVNNIVGMAGGGDYVYNQIAALVGLPPYTL